jgi:DNA-binding NarL/FixJ family response regulator
MTLRTVVVDDEPLPRQRIVDLVRAHDSLSLVGEADDGAPASDVIVETRPDLVLPRHPASGARTAFQVNRRVGRRGAARRRLRDGVRRVRHSCVRGRRHRYLLKPVTAERFAAAVTRVLARLARREGSGDED